MLKNHSKVTSKILDMVEEDLYALSEIKDVSMSIREFNKIKYPAPKHYTKKDVIRIRKKLHVSQSVFAYLLNASESTVRKWEIGVKEPGGANCRLLQIIENMGIGIFRLN